MSEKIRRMTGIILLTVSLLLCIAGSVQPESDDSLRYCSGTKQGYVITEIGAECNGTVSVNDPDPEELTALPGVGETLAQKIAENYYQYGPFYYAEDLESVKGIGTVKLNGFRELINFSQEESRE